MDCHGYLVNPILDPGSCLFVFLLICDHIWIYMRYIFGVIYCMHIDSRDVGLITCSRSNPLVNINLGGNIQSRTETQSWSK